MKKLLLILLCFPMIFNSCKKEEETANQNSSGQGWTKTFDNGQGRFVQETFDGGYIIMYHYEDHSSGYCNAYLLKTDVNGMQEWIQSSDSIYEHNEWGQCAYQTSDAGYISVTSNYNGLNLIKTDPNGTQDWLQVLGNEQYRSKSIQQTSDEGYMVSAVMQNDFGYDSICLIKTNENGTQQWIQTFNFETSSENMHHIQEIVGGGYVLCGTTYHSNLKKIRLIKTDEQGNIIWNKTYSGPNNLTAAGKSVQQTTDGGYIIIGSCKLSSGDDGDIYLIKTDNLGSQQWSKTFGGSFDDVGRCVKQTADGGYIITGYIESMQTGDVFLIKTDPQGDMLWERTFDSGDYDEGWSVDQTTDGGYIITGFKGSVNSDNVWLIKTDSQGNY